MSAFRLLRYHHATLTTPPGSEGAARAFYCEILGFTEIPKPAGLRPDGVWLEGGWAAPISDAPPGSGRALLQLHLTIQDDIDRPANRAHLAFLVDDLSALRARLAAAGITITESIASIPGHTRFECRDPFGNRLEFLQENA